MRGKPGGGSPPCRRECLISGRARQTLELPDSLFRLEARLLPSVPQAPRLLSERWNRLGAPHPGHLLLWGTILWHEACHLVIASWLQETQPFRGVWQGLGQALGSSREQLLTSVLKHFPPTPVFRSQVTPAAFLEQAPQTAIEEAVLIWLAARNPALKAMEPVLSDQELLRETPDYGRLVLWFEANPSSRGEGTGLSLVDRLLEPIRRHPHDLVAQIGALDQLLEGTLSANFPALWIRWEELLRESTPRGGGHGGPPPPPLSTTYEGHRMGIFYSRDTDWMPRLTLMAKNTPVWLHQLSERYGRPLTRLSEIPDQELDLLAEWGITGLWLIGLWTRSPASRRIKQLCGQREAEASAYALQDYTIAPSLGGEEALENLKDRALQRGIRLAADMVPNHMGLDAPLVLERPELFLQAEAPPFPNYRFTGEDLSPSPHRSIRIEDGYLTRSDASVVFAYQERETDRTRYIYHGNDGTSTPWNDTAQLNFMLPETRQVVMEKILKVARLFPVVRFDAAMTLTRFHYQRLWFPLPGQGGDIPSRSGLLEDQADFDAAMPHEFWREVVDTLARETPDTLLLAEAFWMMEPYFVRHLGMHRVYHSAFMHAMLSGHNGPFRESLKGMLREDPRLLTRFVHFLSNPDEASAISQFGDGDRYFSAVCLQVTLPGLPMLAHGQIEGLYEKYGMDFSKALWQEPIRHDLVARHRQWVVPLLRERALYSGTEHFLLLSLQTPEGEAPDVYAFINGAESQRRLVVVNHAPHPVSGLLRGPDPQAHPQAAASFSWLSALLPGQAAHTPWLLACDQRSGEDHLLSLELLGTQGLFCELGPYETVVLGPFHLIGDQGGLLSELFPSLRPFPHQALRHHLGERRKELLWHNLEVLWNRLWQRPEWSTPEWLSWVQLAETWPGASHQPGPKRTARVLETLRRIEPKLFPLLLRFLGQRPPLPVLEDWVWGPKPGPEEPIRSPRDWVGRLIAEDSGPLGLLRHLAAARRGRIRRRRERRSTT